MKTNFTFEELSKVFASVAKIEKLTANQLEADKAYEEHSAIFEDEFAKYGYTFFRAPKSLQTMFDEKCALMDKAEKERKKAFKAVKDFAALVEVGNGVRDNWTEDEVKGYIDGKRFYQIERIASYCRYLAVVIANRVR